MAGRSQRVGGGSRDTHVGAQRVCVLSEWLTPVAQRGGSRGVWVGVKWVVNSVQNVDSLRPVPSPPM